MTNLYLQYRNSITDPWTAVPAVLMSAFPSVAAGAIPVHAIELETAPQAVTPCGCSGDLTDDSYLILRPMFAPIPLALESTLLTFLMQYKTATYHEAKFERYGQGGYVTAMLSLIKTNEQNGTYGTFTLSFRLAAAIRDTLTNT